MRRPLKYKWNSASGLPSVWQVKVRRLWRSTVVFLGIKMSFVPPGASKKRSKITRLIQERLCISFTRYCSLSIRSSLDIYWCLFLFSFTFLSPYSACFCVFFNFLTRFSRPALRLLLLTSYFVWSLCLFLSSLSSFENLSPRTWIITISSGWQSFSSAAIVALQID